MKRVLLICCSSLVLLACGEKPQAMGGSPKSDSAAFAGTGTGFANKDWKQGDKTSWESHMKARGQYGQNDYTRMN